MKTLLFFVAAAFTLSPVIGSEVPRRKILFFTKSSGFEHEVISWKKGQPSYAEARLLELGEKNNWEFTFSKDGSKFSAEYLKGFDAVMFYTTGDLCSEGTDANPPMTPQGKQALFDYVRSGKGFVGTHSASDTFHTDNESLKGPERYVNHGEKADPYVRFIGAEFIRHGAQQAAKSIVIDPKFPGLESVGSDFSIHEEWYSLKDFTPDLHVLTVMDAPAMTGLEYARPMFPNTWAKREGNGRVWYTSMGHREDVWTNPIFQSMLTGGIKWACGDVSGDTAPNLAKAAPQAHVNPAYIEPKPPAPKKVK